MPGACRHVAVLALFAVTLVMYEAKRSGCDRALRHSRRSAAPTR